MNPQQKKNEVAIIQDPAAAQSKSEIEERQGHFARASTPRPVHRRLRGYAFDPSLSTRMDTAPVNEVVYRIPWEDKSTAPDVGLAPGPVGEYVEVVDFDPASGCFYNPVDLSDPYVIAQDGLAPSEGNPQFHQQMVYAVVMTTIRNFEKALGRPALWSSRGRRGYVKRLRIYPHALREGNAYYSPDKKALLFGYFPAGPDRPGKFLPGGIVFTCLSHDVIAHETTHALLHGTYSLSIEANHHDSLAFHEAFADIVALFQHFTFRNVLRHQIARTRGDLSSQNLLGELAQQFGDAIGNYGALRTAIGEYGVDGVWRRKAPDPDDYRTVSEPHARGAILVAAVFDAFIAIYNGRVADLLRIASSGTGILPEGELHPDLVNRLAEEAARAAQHVLTACIRALDYCPPVDVGFGDYLRAVITADADLVPEDDKGYRIAFIEAFRGRGIYPRDIRVLSPESLKWPEVGASQGFFRPLADELRNSANELTFVRDRAEVHRRSSALAAKLHGWICAEGHSQLKEFSKVAGVTFEFDLEGLRRGSANPNIPAFEFHSLRPARRVGPDGITLNQLIISFVQTRDLPLGGGGDEEVIRFRGGSTMILDLDSMELKYAITKSIRDEARLERVRKYRTQTLSDGSMQATYFREINRVAEPFAMLHRSRDYGTP